MIQIHHDDSFTSDNMIDKHLSRILMHYKLFSWGSINISQDKNYISIECHIWLCVLCRWAIDLQGNGDMVEISACKFQVGVYNKHIMLCSYLFILVDTLTTMLLRPRLLAWINFNPSKDNSLHAQWSMFCYIFPNINSATIGIWEWVSTFIPQCIMDVLTYPRWD